MKKINDLENLAKKYRRDLFEKLLIIKQGHPGSIFSMIEIVVALYHGGFVNHDSEKNIFLDKIEKKFGKKALDNIKDMTKVNLKRKILGD